MRCAPRKYFSIGKRSAPLFIRKFWALPYVCQAFAASLDNRFTANGGRGVLAILPRKSYSVCRTWFFDCWSAVPLRGHSRFFVFPPNFSVKFLRQISPPISPSTLRFSMLKALFALHIFCIYANIFTILRINLQKSHSRCFLKKNFCNFVQICSRKNWQFNFCAKFEQSNNLANFINLNQENRHRHTFFIN